jgi:hypothetical protein
MRFPFAILSTLAIAALLPAQTQTVRGQIEDVPNSQPRTFVLDCTTIPVQSSTLNLGMMLDTPAILDVVNVGTAQAPVLEVSAVTPTARNFEMGNLRIGHPDRWEVFAPTGSFALVFVDFTAHTGWMPFGSSGVFLLGGGAATLTSGMTNQEGKLEFNFTMPNVPQLVGSSFTAQSLIGDHGNWLFSNPDCKVAQAQ